MGVDARIRRLCELPTEDDMVIATSGHVNIVMEPHMRNRLRACAQYWETLGANKMVLDWVHRGYCLWFQNECPIIRGINQPSCYEPEQKQFVTDSVESLLARGVIGKWDTGKWGEPRVISPLKVVPKKGNLWRLILDLSRMNRYLQFPRFKYESVSMVRDVFELGDWLFTWDLKDGYWHVDMHESSRTYMCFEWESQLYYFAVMPFGLAPACWVFTKLVRVPMSFMRKQGLKCLGYIDDGLAGHALFSEAMRLKNMTLAVFEGCGWSVNYPKSSLELTHVKEFIGFLIDTVGEGEGLLSPSVSRQNKIMETASSLLQARRVSARVLAQFTGYIVSLRPCLDPMALMFTRHLYVLIRRLEEQYGWDWWYLWEDNDPAKHELGVWLTNFQRWKARGIWSSGEPHLVQAQDASDTAVGGWIGELGGAGVGIVRGIAHRFWMPDSVEMAAARLSDLDQAQSSTHRELWAVWFMFSTFAESRLRDQWVRVQADNQALYFIASKGKASNLSTHQLLVDLFWLCQEYNIRWDVVWLPRELNQLADDLSKWVDRDDWCLNKHHWAVICARMGPFDCDRFASVDTALLPNYCALHWGPGCLYVDCFSRSWRNTISWWNPNPVDAGRVIVKALSESASGALLIPVWPSAPWWLKLCPDGRHFGAWITGWLELPAHGSLFTRGKGKGLWNAHPPRTRMVVVNLLGTRGRGELPESFCAEGPEGCLMCR